MPSFVLYPYATAGECITVNVHASDGLIVDGASVDASAEEFTAGTVSIRCQVDTEEIRRVAPPDADADSDVGLALRLMSVSGRLRKLLKAPSRTFDHEFDLPIDRAGFRGDLTISPLVLLRTHLQPVTGFANEAGSIIGWGEDVTVVFDEHIRPPGKSIPTEWRSFREDGTLTDGHLFALKPGDSVPTIFLNSDVTGAYEILQSKGTHGAKARIRDATFHQIAFQVWSSLVARSWSQFAGAANEELSAEEALEYVGGWEEAVLRDWADHLFPEAADRERALAMMVDAARNEDATLFIGRLTTAIQERFATVKSFQGLAREHHRFEEPADVH